MLETKEFKLNDTLRLRSISTQPVRFDSVPGRLDAVIVYEWNEYVVESIAAPESGTRLELRGQAPEMKRLSPAMVSFCYQNQIGHSEIQILVDGVKKYDLQLEVLSPKYPTLGAHNDLLHNMVGSIAEKAASLPFTIDAGTSFPTGESTRPRSDLFTLYFFEREGAKILESLETVVRDPKRILDSEDRISKLDELSRFDPLNFFEALSDSRLQVVKPGQPAYDLGIVRRLRSNHSQVSYLPVDVYESRAEESLDTLEHRFIRFFLDELIASVGRLSSSPFLRNKAEDLNRFRGSIVEAIQSSFLGDITGSSVIPTASRVLLQAHGYRDLLELWRRFQVAQDPFESLDRAIDAHNIATLYEWWCFFALIHRLEEFLGEKARLKASAIDEFTGLSEGIEVSFGAGWQMLYNENFRRSSLNLHSYSLTLRPDFVLVRNGRPTAGLDAKFRFVSQDWGVAADDPDEADEGSETTQRLAKQADIYKMHTYRDALGLKSSIALYPGNTSRFYAVAGGPVLPLTLETLFQNPDVEGVGAVPLAPEDFKW